MKTAIEIPNAPAENGEAVRSSAGFAGFVVEAVCVNTETHKTYWKEIARYPDRETAESVVAINRVGEWRIREEQPANAAGEQPRKENHE